MSVRQIQEELNKLTPAELAEVEKHLQLLRVITASDYKTRIAEAHRRMDDGKFVGEDEFEARIAEREKKAAS